MGEQLSSDHSALLQFMEKLKMVEEELGLTADQVYNADERVLETFAVVTICPPRRVKCTRQKGAHGFIQL